MSGQQKLCKTILVIDDEREVLNILQEMLKKMAEQVLVADNGRVGLDLVRTHKPTLIISDYFMPLLNGLELLKSLNEEGFQVPVIWLTAHADQEIQRQAWVSGVYDVLEKPFLGDRLRQCVSGAMSWQPNTSATAAPGLAAKITSREIKLAIELRNYTKLTQLCEKKNISITTLVNRLIEEEIKKCA